MRVGLARRCVPVTRRFRDGVSFGGNYTLSLSDNGTTGVPAAAAQS